MTPKDSSSRLSGRARSPRPPSSTPQSHKAAVSHTTASTFHRTVSVSAPTTTPTDEQPTPPININNYNNDHHHLGNNHHNHHNHHDHHNHHNHHNHHHHNNMPCFTLECLTNLKGGSESKPESGDDSNQESTPASETESMPGGGSTTYPSTGAGSMPGAESSTETKTTTPFGTDSSNTGGSKGHQPSPASSRGSSNSHSSSRMFKTVSTNNSFKTKNGVKILTQEVTTVYNGVKTVELYENGVLKSKTVNGVPQAVTD